MAIKIKTTLIILFTFILGVALGAIITNAFLKYRMEKILSMSAPEGFVAHFERIIEPTEKQRESVKKILNQYGKKILQMREKNLKEFFAIDQAMRKELNSVLTTEQKKRLEKRFFKHRPGRFLRPPGDRPPPPPPWKDKPPDLEDGHRPMEEMRERDRKEDV